LVTFSLQRREELLAIDALTTLQGCNIGDHGVSLVSRIPKIFAGGEEIRTATPTTVAASWKWPA
jgi:hypothetical protein